MNSLKIGFVLDDSLDKADGVQQYVLALGQWLSSQGHTVHYLVGETKRQDLSKVHSLARNIRVRFNGNRMSMPLPASKQRLRDLLRQEAFDILHIQMPYSPWLAHRIIKLAPRETAIVGTFHVAPDSHVVTAATKALGLWLHGSLKRFTAFLSVSSTAQAFARQTFGIESRVLPNVIDYPRFASGRPISKYRDSKTTILFFGRLVPRKGCMLLLQAMHQLMAEHPELVSNCRLLICGKGPLESELKQYCDAHQLSPITEFAGYIDEEDKPDYYASADIAVFPSSGGESFGIVLLEAMASGKAAVLAGDNPGYASVLAERPDMLFDAHEPAILAKKIRKLLENKQLRASVASWGSEYTKRFDTAAVGQQLLTVYKEALRKTQNVQ